MKVKAPSPRDIRNSIRNLANLYAPSKEAAEQSLLNFGLNPEIEKPRAKSNPDASAIVRVPREIVIPEHTLQTALLGLLQRDKRVAWAGRFNSGKFELEGSGGNANRWFSATTVKGLSDILGCMVGGGGIPGKMLAFEVKEGSASARRAVMSVIAEVDAGTFDPFRSSAAKARIAWQYEFLLKVRRSGGIGEFVFDVDEAMRCLL